MKFLVCDDEYAWRRALSRVLDGEVLQAANIADGVMLAAKHQPNVLLLDVILTDGLGWEAIPRFRQASPRTEIIVMSAFGRRADGVRCVGSEYRAFAYLDKLEGLDAIARVVRSAQTASLLSEVRRQVQDSAPSAKRAVACR